ncbi:MAG TPA: hypothetical protein VGX92_13935 [Pyrinomonadaceae bacterium]|jgi:hypothetical protein|nr:hypothetical protein [Pyrinomonadaceae bacterium]
MKDKILLVLFSFLLVCSSSILTGAQQKQQQIFALDAAHVDEEYDLSIVDVLRDKYEQELQSNSDAPIFQWSLASGELPPGLNLTSDGRIVGTPGIARKRAYIFRANVADASLPTPRALGMTFSLSITPSKNVDSQVRLAKVGTPKLVDREDGGTTNENPEADATTLAEPSLGTTDNSQSTGVVKSPQSSAPKGAAKTNPVVITAADVLPPDDDQAQVTITIKDPAVASILIIEPQSNYLKQVDEIPATKIIAQRIRLRSTKNTIRVLAFKKDGTKFEPDATKVITLSKVPVADQVTPVTDEVKRVVLGQRFELQDQPDFPLNVKLNDPEGISRLYFQITDAKGKVLDEGTQDVAKSNDKDKKVLPLQQVLIRVGTGENRIYVAGFNSAGLKVGDATTSILCKGNCSGPSTETPRVALEEPFRVTEQIDSPVVITPNDPQKKIRSYYYIVRDRNERIIDENPVDVVPDANGDPAPQSIIVRLNEERNTISVFGRDADEEKITNTATTVITCLRCKGASSVRTGSSIFTRAILGFEQSGGSASDSQQKPFLDFFFGAPIGGGRRRDGDDTPPRFSTWGNVRFASVPRQGVTGATLQNFASNFATTFQGLDVNGLVQGFDFMAGLDIRLIPTGDKGYFNLIPGTKQRTSVSFTLGAGAISPLTSRQIPPQIFVVPKVNNVIDPTFLALFPEAKDKTNIAFVTPERDRFFRQYYGGLRFKTFFYDKHDVLINRFPAILDVTFGQNEIVSGKLHNTVFRLEGFYPFPFKATSFLYLYGTAMLKLGGHGAESTLPLFLNSPSPPISLPNPNTAIVPIDRHPQFQPSQDYYRFGFGINLIELLDRFRPAPVP